MKTYVTVCKNVILRNLKRGRNDPPIRVSRGKYGRASHHHTYRNGRITVRSEMHEPLPWGARVWVEIED
jgi:hypothetical protein